MKLLKFSTLLVKITHKNSETVSYQNYTDIYCRNYKHFIPEQSAFPYKHLVVNDSYTLICAQLEVDDKASWFFWKAFPHLGNEEGILQDPQLEDFIAERAREIA